MADAWKIVAEVSKTEARAALVAHEEALDWPAEWVVTGMEVADHLPDDWTVEVYLDREPGPDDLQRVAVEFLGVQGAVSVYQDIRYLFSPGGQLGGQAVLSDTGRIADALFLPYWFWGGAITLAIAAMVWKSLQVAGRY